MTAERFAKLGIEAARLGLRVNCVISRDIEYGLSAYEAIDKEVSIRRAPLGDDPSRRIKRPMLRSAA